MSDILKWLFYSYRRHKALEAEPNPGHYALVELSKKMPNFITLTQNVDGMSKDIRASILKRNILLASFSSHPFPHPPSYSQLMTNQHSTGLSQRANHPRPQLKLLHGSLFDIKCFNCSYIELNNFDDPFHPLLAITTEDDDRLAPSSNTVRATAAYLDPNVNTTTIDPSRLPHCPSCKTGLLRPGVVWFGENLPRHTLNEIDAWVEEEDKIDLILVIGTTATVYPAAGYIEVARERGARVAVVNMEGMEGELGAASNLTKDDFLFQGDAGVILPEILKPIIG
jgi:NAD-dependent SIR2 family protein deacetylase